MPFKKGEPRAAGAGKPLGFKAEKTIEKEAIRDYIRSRVWTEMPELLDAQFAQAKGIRTFVLRDADGKFQRITSAEAAVAAMNDPGELYEFWVKDPSTPAFTDLVNRAADKPKEQEQEIRVTGVDVVSILQQRHAKYRKEPT